MRKSLLILIAVLIANLAVGQDLGRTIALTNDVPDSLYKDLPLPISGPIEKWDLLFTKLMSAANDDIGSIVRIAYYGDSHVAGGNLPYTVATTLQSVFGDAGHGFIPLERGWRWQYHKGIDWKFQNWKTQVITFNKRNDGLYGYGGVVATSQTNSSTTITTVDEEFGNSVSEIELWYRAEPKAGKLLLQIDAEPAETLIAYAERAMDTRWQREVTEGQHSFTVKSIGGAPVLTYGAIFEEKYSPGVVVDNCGLLGAFVSKLLNWNREHIANQFKMRDVDLIMLGFGGNAIQVPSVVNAENEFAVYCKVIEMFNEVAPGVPILIITPTDHGMKENGQIVSMPDQIKVVNIQHRVAEKYGVPIFDVWQAMGGDGSIAKWTYSKPMLAAGDYRHLTLHGYRVLGKWIGQALIEALDRYLNQLSPPGTFFAKLKETKPVEIDYFTKDSMETIVIDTAEKESTPKETIRTELIIDTVKRVPDTTLKSREYTLEELEALIATSEAKDTAQLVSNIKNNDIAVRIIAFEDAPAGKVLQFGAFSDSVKAIEHAKLVLDKIGYAPWILAESNMYKVIVGYDLSDDAINDVKQIVREKAPAELLGEENWQVI